MSKISFTISGLMQSYGDTTYSAYRTTYDHPTKSAIIGMIAAALGYKRNEQAKIDQLSQSLHFSYYTIQPGSQTCDYQNVHYTNFKSKKSTYIPGYFGKTLKQTWRDYLQDAKFGIILTGDHDLLKKIEYALKHPIFVLYLGRKSYPLDRPLDIIFKN